MKFARKYGVLNKSMNEVKLKYGEKKEEVER